jgi:hypothetical protein
MTKTCTKCGVGYQGHPKSKFCSNECRELARKEYEVSYYLNRQEEQKLRALKYYEEHREEQRVKQNARYKTPEGQRKKQDSRLIYSYGITLDEYERMLNGQGGKCAMFEFCGSTEPGDGGRWHVDHMHLPDEVWKAMPPEEKRKHVRGLLCRDCNGARVSGNTLESARAVVIYLEKANKPKP